MFVLCLASTNKSNNGDLQQRDATEECSNITSLSIPNSSEAVGITSFVQEACESVTALSKYYKAPLERMPQTDIQDLKSYFARPRLVTTGTLLPIRGLQYNASYAINTILTTIFPNGLNRLYGVYGMRYTSCWRLLVNSTPFHQGLVVMSYQYDTDANTYSRGTADPCTSTNIPHVRLDLSTSTACELRAPFLWENDFAPILGSASAPGTFAISNVLPVLGGASLAQPQYSLYFWLEDLEFYGATGNSTDVILQSGVEKELDFDARPVSSSFSLASRAVSWIARGVPSLSSIAGPAAWFLGKTSGVLRYLGFSKPQIQDPIVRMLNITSASEANVDLPSATLMVAPFVSNHTVLDPSMGATDVDEMALSYVFSQWSQICTATIKSTDAPGTAVYATNVGPSVFWYRNFIGGPGYNKAVPLLSGMTNNSFMPSHIFYFASMFQAWRGSIKFRFTFAKTKFHSGRVLVGMIPSAVIDTSTVASGPEIVSGVLPQPYGYSAIFDLRDGNVFDFEVPYMLYLPYLPFNTGCGGLTLTVIDQLIAPASVSSSIDFLVEVAGGSNFEVAQFVGPTFAPSPFGVLTLQSGLVDTVESEGLSPHTFGESFSSLKQLVSIPSRFQFNIATNTTYVLSAMPYYYSRPYPSSVPGPIGTAMRNRSFATCGVVSKTFLYARGSTDFHLYDATSILPGLVFSAFNNPSFTNTQTTDSTYLHKSSANVPRVISNNGNLHVRFPNYSLYRRIVTSSFDGQLWNPTVAAQANLGINPLYGHNVGVLYINNPTTGTKTVLASTAAGDDCRLSHYMGPIPLTLPSTNAGTVYDPDSDF